MTVMNYSFNPLCLSLHLHSVAFTLQLGHPVFYLSDFLTNLQYCSNSIVLLGCGLNFSPSVSDSPLIVLHTSYSDAVKICMNYSPALPRGCFYCGHFSVLFIS